LSRLMDLVFSQEVVPVTAHARDPSAIAGAAEVGVQLRRTVATVPRIIADNVAAYYMRENPKEDWDLRTDFPNVAPPFPSFWIEWRLPHEANVGGRIVLHPPGCRCSTVLS